MKAGKIIARLRSDRGWSQNDLAEQSGVSHVMIGKYERGDATPSLEVAKKIADAFEVSLDFLVGEGQNSTFDKKGVERLQQIEQLPNEDKKHVYAMLDAFLRDFRAKAAYAS